MPTIDINTQRNSGGIGNAWDFFDRQRVLHAVGALVAGRRPAHAAVGRRVPAHAPRQRVHVAHQRRPRLRQLGVLLHRPRRLGRRLGSRSGRHAARLPRAGRRRVRPGRLEDRRRPDRQRRPALRRVRDAHASATAASATTTCRRPRRRSACSPASTCRQRAVLPARLRPARRSASTSVPGTSVDISQIHVAPNDSTLRGDRNNVAPRVGFAWQPTFAPAFVIRGGWGLYYERPSAGFKVDLQRAAPYFLYQNVPAPLDMAESVSAAERQPVPDPAQRPHRPRRQRRAALGQGRRHGVPGDVAVQRKNNTFIDPLVETPSMQQWSANVQCEASRHLLVDLRYVGSRGQDLLGKINLAVPVDPRVTPVNGFTDIYDAQRRADQPGLLRAGGVPRPQSQRRLPAAHQRRPLDLPLVPDEPARPLRHARVPHGRLHLRQGRSTRCRRIARSSSTIRRRPENNYGLADYDRPHRLTTAWVLLAAGRRTSAACCAR